jgi:hypothetical protein
MGVWVFPLGTAVVFRCRLRHGCLGVLIRNRECSLLQLGFRPVAHRVFGLLQSLVGAAISFHCRLYHEYLGVPIRHRDCFPLPIAPLVFGCPH